MAAKPKGLGRGLDALLAGNSSEPQRQGAQARQIVEEKGLRQVTDTGAIETAIDEIIAKSPDKVEQVKSKPTMLGWFVGQVMKSSGGRWSASRPFCIKGSPSPSMGMSRQRRRSSRPISCPGSFAAPSGISWSAD